MENNSPWIDLDEREKEAVTLAHILAALGWDQETYMPESAVQGRSEQMSLLETLLHKIFTRPDLEALLKACGDKVQTDRERARLRVWNRLRARKILLPAELVEKKAALVVQSQAVWAKARQTNDFLSFLPYLRQLVDIAKETAQRIGFSDHPYTALLDEYEPGMTTLEVEKIFYQLKPGLQDILSKIHSRPRPDTSVLEKTFPVSSQEKYGREVLSAMGYDWKRGRLDVTTHPFCTTLGFDDVRLTTRYDEKFFNSAVYGMIHEMGHGLYEQGFSQELKHTLLSDGTSLGIHESQSRFWENMVARSPQWIQWTWPKLLEIFPNALSNQTPDVFVRALNTVEPTMIRVEADEVTYSLHIILRFEMEKALVDGTLDPKDVPEVWNAKTQELLGLSPANDSEGCLQDIHWSMGGIGYFPTYALGNLYAAQWRSAIKRVMPFEAHILKGEFQPILDWLRKNIHQWGRSFTAGELVKNITGENLNPQYFINYLQEKYGTLYGF